MIIDQLDNWKQYNFGPVWTLAFEFLQSLTKESEERKYSIQGEDLFAIVSRYKTKARENAVLEAHQKYVDIQCIVGGSELIECFPQKALEADVLYDESKDAEFYKYPESAFTSVTLHPGMFAVFFPQDAHMPSLMTDGKSEEVLKVVVKVRASLLAAQ